jgi:predicted ABC-type ATPase
MLVAKKILMIAGPNGAGKTTMTQELTTRGSSILYEFINADE